MEQCESNLMSCIRLNKDILTVDHIKFIFYGVVRGLLWIHSRGIIHRDLKPLNILMTSEYDVKICDFGSAVVCRTTQQTKENLPCTGKHIGSKHFRAPEIYLEYSTGYGQACDMWSLGLVLVELFNKENFQRAETTEDYLKFLFELLG